MVDTTTVQVIFIFATFLEAFICGLLPVKCKALKESPRALGVANAFAGGVFISISLLHIMPEQVGSYADWYAEKHPDKANDDDDSDPFPLPFFLLVAGYCLILIMDKVLFTAPELLKQPQEVKNGDLTNLARAQNNLR